MAIRAGLFDLGNVLVSFDNNLKLRRLSEVLLIPVAKVGELLHAERWQDQYECGLIDTNTFMRRLLAACREPPPMPVVVEAFSDIFEPIAGMPEILSTLRSQGLRLGMVSNTNEAHAQHIWNKFGLEQYFDQLILSYQVKQMKPAGAYYAKAAEIIGVVPSEAFFVDDLADNIAGARKFGFHGVLFEGVAALRRTLRDQHALLV